MSIFHEFSAQPKRLIAFLAAARERLVLAYAPEDQVADHIAEGRLIRVLEDGRPAIFRLPPPLTSRRQQTPAIALLVNAMRDRGS